MKRFINYSFIAYSIFLLCFSSTAEAKSVVVHCLEDFQKSKTRECTRFVINGEVDLKGTYLLLPPNSKLFFSTGSLKNGIIEGNNTRIKSTTENVFHNCSIKGKWQTSCAYSSMFDADMDAMTLLQNLSCLSPNVLLFANRDYIIKAEGKEIKVNKLAAAGKEKPVLQFLTIDPNVSGIILSGNSITLRNIIVKDDYEQKIETLNAKNKATIGNTIEIKSSTNKVESLLIDGCSFYGGTSSSYVASSQTRNCLISNCSFSGYMADHAVYCSMCAEQFTIQDCKVSDVPQTRGVFKIRTSKNVRLFYLKNIEVYNLNGYLAAVGLLETPYTKIFLDHITVKKDKSNNSTFYGFCIYDETKSLNGTGRYNAEEIILSNCFFDYGYSGSPIIYPGSEKRVCVKTIQYLNNTARGSNFGGGESDYLLVRNCSYSDCCDKTGIELNARKIEINKVSFTQSKEETINNLFLINYSTDVTQSVTLKKVDADMNMKDIFKVFHGTNLQINVYRSNVANLTNSVVFAKKDSKFNYKLRKVSERRDGEFKVSDAF